MKKIESILWKLNFIQMKKLNAIVSIELNWIELNLNWTKLNLDWIQIHIRMEYEFNSI
jgi:hypothetical protein